MMRWKLMIRKMEKKKGFRVLCCFSPSGCDVFWHIFYSFYGNASIFVIENIEFSFSMREYELYFCTFRTWRLCLCTGCVVEQEWLLSFLSCCWQNPSLFSPSGHQPQRPDQFVFLSSLLLTHNVPVGVFYSVLNNIELFCCACPVADVHLFISGSPDCAGGAEAHVQLADGMSLLSATHRSCESLGRLTLWFWIQIRQLPSLYGARW